MGRKRPLPDQMTPDPRFGYCAYLGRDHRRADSTYSEVNGKRVELCRFCNKIWEDKG